MPQPRLTLPLFFSMQVEATRALGFAARTALFSVGVLVACSSSDSTPNGGTGTAGSAGAGANVGSAGAAAGSIGIGGVGGAGSGASGASTGGAASGTGGDSAGQGGTTTGGAGVAGGGTSVAGGGAGTGGASAGAGGVNNEPFALKSSAFKDGEEIPLAYKCAEVTPKGLNQSPPLSWGPGPAGTRSYAIVLNHVPTPEHWVLWDIPANVTSLSANIEHVGVPAMPLGSKQSQVDLDGFKGSGYLGPCPQTANVRQNYTFTLYALDVPVIGRLSSAATPTQAAAEVKAHLVAGSRGVTLTGSQIQTP